MTAACMTALPSAASGERQRHPRFREGLGAIRRDHGCWPRTSSTSTPWCSVRPAPSSPPSTTRCSADGRAPSDSSTPLRVPARSSERSRQDGWIGSAAKVSRSSLAVCVWGAAIVAFGLVRTLWVALVVLAVAGWADVISAVLRTTVLQTHAGEALRSRIASVQMATVEGGPRLGGFESGALGRGDHDGGLGRRGRSRRHRWRTDHRRRVPGFRRYRRSESQDR